MAESGSQIFGIDSKYFVIGVIGICVIVGVASALILSGGIGSGNDVDWEELSENAIENRGYDVVRMVSCHGTYTSDTAMSYGSFYTTGNVLKNYNISFVNDGGRWIVSNCLVY